MECAILSKTFIPANQYAIPQIINEADAYLKYKKDVSTLAVPHARPKSTYHSNTLFFKGFF